MESTAELVRFPLLKHRTDHIYNPCTIPWRSPSDNPRQVTPTEVLWIELFRKSIPSFRWFKSQDFLLLCISIRLSYGWDQVLKTYFMIASSVVIRCRKDFGFTVPLLLSHRATLVRSIVWDAFIRSVDEAFKCIMWFSLNLVYTSFEVLTELTSRYN